MDDAEIRAGLSQLASSISSLERKLSGLDSKVARVDRNIDRTSDAVASIANTLVPAVTRIKSDLSKLAEELRHNRLRDAARNKRDDMDRELQERFGPHEEVRKLARNIIHIVSTGVIDDKVILDAAQRRMVDLPDYWLAPAIVAVAAWLSGDEVKCDEALNLAIRLDRSKTALFMALLLRQHARGRALQQWIDMYLTGLQPRNLPPDFHVVINAVAGGVLGDGSAPKLGNWMSDRYLDETRSRQSRAEGVREWRERLQTIITVAEFAPTLARSSPDWAALRDRHKANVEIEAAERHFRGRFEAGADIPADLADRVRELVEKLARTPDADEEQLRRDRQLEDAVSQTGDREEEQRRLDAENASQMESLNILRLVSAAAFRPSSGGKGPAPTVTELLGIVLSRELIDSAAESLYEGTQRPAKVEMRVGQHPERTCFFSCATDEEVTPEALEAQAAAWEDHIKDQIRGETFEQQDRLRKFARRPFPAALASSGVIGAAPVAVATGIPTIDFAAPAIAIAAGAGSWLALLLRRQHRTRSVGARQMPTISKTLNEAARELSQFFAQEQRSAHLRSELQQFLRKLTPDDAYSVVRTVASPPFLRSRDFPEWTPLPPGYHPELGSMDYRPLP